MCNHPPEGKETKVNQSLNHGLNPVLVIILLQLVLMMASCQNAIWCVEVSGGHWDRAASRGG